MGRFNLQWHITDECNLHCQHCYQENHNPKTMDLADAKTAIDQFEDLYLRLGNSKIQGHITITGGEPFVADALFPIVEYLLSRQPQFRFAILTNGTLINESAVRQLTRYRPTYVQVSIEGDRQKHDAIRGVGSFDQAVLGIRQLRAAGIVTTISFTAHRNNVNQFAKVISIASRLKVNRVWTDRLIPIGKGSSLVDQILSPQETQLFYAQLARLRTSPLRRLKSSTEIAAHRALQFLYTGERPYQCSAGRTLLALLPSGDLLPCRRLPICVGNIFKTSMHDLYTQSEILHQLRNADIVAIGCESCFYRKTCAGGLRCLAYATNGDWKNADPGCWISTVTEGGK